MADSIPSTMKAWQFSDGSGGLDKHLHLNNSAPLPPKAKNLGTDEILIKVIASSINPIDYKLAEFFVRRFVYGADATPAHDYAGRVVATGPNSGKYSKQDLKPGQLVFGRLDNPTKHGTLAEYTVATRIGCVPIPDGVKPIDAAAMTTAALTSYQTIVPFVKSGDRIFVNGGSGGVGLGSIQIAKILGCHIVVTCSTPNVDLCKSLGADQVIDYKKQNVLAELQKLPKFNHVVDQVSTPKELFYKAQTYTTPKATYVQIAGEFNPLAFADMLSRMYWPGFLGGGKRKFRFQSLESKQEDFQQLAEWIGKGKLKAVIDETYGFEDNGPVKAFLKLKTGRARGKIMVRVAE